MRVLGIETSCDETGVAVYDSRQGLLYETLYSQAELHAVYGGVVPELAARDHIRRLGPLVRTALDQAGKLEGIAYTAGPGLVGALLVGASLARGLALARQLPALGVHHMEGHLLAPMMMPRAPDFPFIALLVSGGHSLLVRADGIGRYQILGDTRDDAAGEAFDKVAKMLGLGYPGGPAVAAAAEHGDAQRFKLPRPMTTRPGCDFSFSGLKTRVRDTLGAQRWGGGPPPRQLVADIAASFQEAMADTLAEKCRRALSQSGLNTLVVAGGVGANQRLRERLAELLDSDHIAIYCPPPALCTDNGAMIAHAGCLRLAAGQAGDRVLQVYPRWSLTTQRPPVATAQLAMG